MNGFTRKNEFCLAFKIEFPIRKPEKVDHVEINRLIPINSPDKLVPWLPSFDLESFEFL